MHSPTASRLVSPRSFPLLVSLCLGGCAGFRLSHVPDPPLLALTPAPAEQAKVCVIRKSDLAFAVAFPTYDNKHLVGATRGPGYFCYLAEPGQHTLAIKADKEVLVDLSAEPGHAYYLHQEVDNNFGFVTCRPQWVSREAAGDLLDGTGYQVLDKVPSNETLPARVPVAPASAPTASP